MDPVFAPHGACVVVFFGSTISFFMLLTMHTLPSAPTETSRIKLTNALQPIGLASTKLELTQSRKPSSIKTSSFDRLLISSSITLDPIMGVSVLP